MQALGPKDSVSKAVLHVYIRVQRECEQLSVVAVCAVDDKGPEHVQTQSGQNGRQRVPVVYHHVCEAKKKMESLDAPIQL